MIPTLAILLLAQTADQMKAALLAQLQALGFPVSDWNEGGVARTIVEVLAAVLASLSTLIAAVAASGFVLLSSGDWLTLTAFQVYGLTRNAAGFTAGNLLLTDGGAGPFTIVAGSLTFVSGDGHRYTNTGAGTLPNNGTLVIAVQAQSPGSGYNTGANTIQKMLTPLPAVTVTNPLQLGTVSQVGIGTGTVSPTGTPTINAVVVVQVLVGGAVGVATFQASVDGGRTFPYSGTTSASWPLPASGMSLVFAGGTFNLGDEYLFSTSWITTAGTDTETDASLQARCQARWPSLGIAPTANVYELWAFAASNQVTQADAIPDLTVPGQVDVYLGAGGGSVPGSVVTAVQAYLNARVPLCTTALAISATPVTLTVTATLYVHNGFQTSALASAGAALAAYVASIGIAGGTAYLSEIIGALAEVAGVRNVAVSAPGGDTTFTPGQAPQLAAALTIVVVP
jgi:phage-related baseplate assembly protein